MSERDDELMMSSPFIRRFFAWVQERFPLPNALLFFALWAAAFLSGRALAVPDGASLTLNPYHAVGFLGAWSYFLLLRVYDEHKDYELDMLNYPNRVLQSGLITLGHLKVAGVVAVVAQLGTTLWLGDGFGPALWWWMAVMVWSALMAREFFIGEWLEQRLVLYAFSHMLSMPLALLWMAHMGARGRWLPPEIGWLAGAAFFSGAAFEVTRKLRAPSEERETVDSYARELGLRTGSVVVLVFLALSVGGQLMLLASVRELTLVWILVALAPLIAPLVTFLRFMSDPTVPRREANEASTALAMLAGYVIVIVAVLTSRPIHWELHMGY